MTVPTVKAELSESQREQLRLAGERAGAAFAVAVRSMRVAGVRMRLRTLEVQRRRLDEQVAAARAELAELTREAVAGRG